MLTLVACKSEPRTRYEDISSVDISNGGDNNNLGLVCIDDIGIEEQEEYYQPEYILDSSDKIPLELGCTYMTNSLMEQVVLFNNTSEKYCITIKNYDEYNTAGNYALGNIQLNKDIISGNMPDILLVDSTLDIHSLANKGVLANIGDLISQDEELADVEYLTNVFKAFSVGDELYTVIPSFGVNTMIARKDMVGDRKDWTMTEFEAYRNTLPGDIKPFGNILLRDNIMYYMMQFCCSDFIDADTGICSFDSQEFIAFLEFANTFPVELEVDYWNKYDGDMLDRAYRDKKAILLECYIGQFQQLVYDIHGTLGSDAMFVGFPGLSGNSSVISSDSDAFVLSAKSENLEGAWSFVRYYLTEEYQTKMLTESLPVMKKAFEEQARQAMVGDYYVNEETGEKEFFDYTYLMNGEEIKLEPLSQEEVDEICNFIYSIEKRRYDNQDILNIITEEAGSYFDGSKSAQDVAQIIQNRVQIYLDEK